MQVGLSFDQAPPIAVPYQFFLAAPGFGVIAGMLLVWTGDAALASRWTPEALALTHLIALGFMLQAMSGALFQFIPVAVGGNVWRPQRVASLLQPLLLLATLLLVGGFLLHRPAWLAAAAPLFLLAIGGFVVVLSLARCPIRSGLRADSGRCYCSLWALGRCSYCSKRHRGRR